MKRSKVILLAVIAVLFGIGVTTAIYSTVVIKYTGTVKMDLRVDKFVGFNIDPDAMHFGVIPPTGRGAGKMVTTNIYNHDIIVLISLEGNLAPWVSVSDNGFILKPGESKEVKFTATVPENATFGNYSGTIRFVYKRVFR